MWPIGHVASAYLIHAFGRRKSTEQPATSTLLILALASGIPDLIDKPLAWYLSILPTGRSLSHSLLLVVPLCIVVGLVTKRFDRPEWGIAFTVGSTSHLLFDALPVLWRDGDAGYLLYPLTGVDPYEGGPPTVFELLQSSITDPYFHLEFVLLAIAVIVWRGQGYPGIATVRHVLDRSA